MNMKFALIAVAAIYASPALAQAVYSQDGKTISSRSGASVLDFRHAKRLPLPTTSKPAPSQLQLLQEGSKATAPSAPRFTAGSIGSGEQNPTRIPQSEFAPNGSGVGAQEFGSGGLPFSTSRVDAYAESVTHTFYPFRAAGKLFFNINGSSYVCSASLVKRGIVVTAAHCVAQYGASMFYSGWQFVPAYTNGNAPYGVWGTTSATVLTSYFNGSDPCAVSDVVCQDDVALLVLSPSSSGAYAGTATGYLGTGANGFNFNSSQQTLVTQLGYPVALDNGAIMERNDAQGSTSASYSNNTLIGSEMTGGSSGGPWIANLGFRPALNGTSVGTYSAHNIVIGVTSWGYTDTSVKTQGASMFTPNNITALLNYVCSTYPDRCQ